MITQNSKGISAAFVLVISLLGTSGCWLAGTSKSNPQTLPPKSNSYDSRAAGLATVKQSLMEECSKSVHPTHKSDTNFWRTCLEISAIECSAVIDQILEKATLMEGKPYTWNGTTTPSLTLGNAIQVAALERIPIKNRLLPRCQRNP